MSVLKTLIANDRGFYETRQILEDGSAIMIQAAPFRKRLIGGCEVLSPEIWLIEFVP